METPRPAPATDRTVSVTRLAASGEGVTEDGTRLAFALPGERVRIAGDPPRAAAILDPAPERVPPACRHFGACGGCLLQHASDAFLLGWKAEIVRRALAARGIEAPFHPPHQSPPFSRRRAVFAGRRTRKGALIGFRAHRSHEIVAIEECPVSRPALPGAREALAALTEAGASRAGTIRLAVTETEGGLDVAVTEAKPLDGPLRQRLAAIAAEHDLARLAWEGEIVAARRPARVAFGRAHVEIPPGGFLQASAEAEAAMAESVAEAVGPSSRRIADLFAGAGTFALRLAERASVHAVEQDADALAALDAAARRATPALRPVTTEARDLNRRPLLAAEFARFDAAAFDPPRAGAEAQAREIARSALPRLAAISCNPVTFARDAEILAGGGFRLLWVRVIDQFRWSPHVELVAAFARA